MTQEELEPVLAAAGIEWDTVGAFRVPCLTEYDDGIRVSYTRLVNVDDFDPLFAVPLSELPKNLEGNRILTYPGNAFRAMLADRGFDWVRPAIVRARLECGV